MRTNFLYTLLFFVFCLEQSARAEIPVFQSGDIVFQTSLSSQSKVIQVATGSKYSHVGIVEVAPDGRTFVIEAISKVSRTDLQSWVARGSEGKFAAFRIVDLSPSKAAAFVTAAASYLGRQYDVFFTRHNDDLYCSELVDFAAHDVGLEFGHYQRFGSLNVNNDQVKALARARWRGHPLCQALHSFEECWPRIQDDEMITPVSLTQDNRLRMIYSNY